MDTEDCAQLGCGSFPQRKENANATTNANGRADAKTNAHENGK